MCNRSKTRDRVVQGERAASSTAPEDSKRWVSKIQEVETVKRDGRRCMDVWNVEVFQDGRKDLLK
jgi:hypothetical protein